MPVPAPGRVNKILFFRSPKNTIFRAARFLFNYHLMFSLNIPFKKLS